MNRFQIEKLYESCGLNDYKIGTVQDLMKIYSIDYKIEGYNKLDDLNRNIYEKFIVNFFNGLGLESRDTLIPKAIYWVEDISYLVPEDDYNLVVGGIVKSIDRNGVKNVIHTWNDEDYKDKEYTEGNPENYLRIEYKHNSRAEWLHVIKSGEQWY